MKMDYPEQLLKYFEYEHLPPKLQATSILFHNLAWELVRLPRCAERTTALRKLLEAKDAAVRATMETETND